MVLRGVHEVRKRWQKRVSGAYFKLVYLFIHNNECLFGCKQLILAYKLGISHETLKSYMEVLKQNGVRVNG